jgi:hypothetical protein
MPFMGTPFVRIELREKLALTAPALPAKATCAFVRFLDTENDDEEMYSLRSSWRRRRGCRRYR